MKPKLQLGCSLREWRRTAGGILFGGVLAAAASLFALPALGAPAASKSSPSIPVEEIGATTAQDGCLFCHKYPGLGRYEKDSRHLVVKRVFYVNDEMHKASYHGRLNCSDCHEDVTTIPHDNAKKVDCGKTCHVMDPSTGQKFSHKKIVEDLNQSAHGAAGSRSENKSDLPACRDCHTNKPYQNDPEVLAKSMGFVKVCQQCHEEKAWVERFYRHVSYRTVHRRSSKEVVKLCSRCHANPDMMGRHKLDVVVGFQDTYHGKAILYGDEEVANCLSCHAPYELNLSPHSILSRKNDKSPVHQDNMQMTCAQSGCHPLASKEFATGSKAHPSQIKAAKLTTIDTEAATDALREEAFQAKVLDWINLFYKVLIAAVVLGLGGHRLLDIYAAYRDRKKGGH